MVYVTLSVSLTLFGLLSDFVGRRMYFSDTVSRKIFEVVAHIGPSICFAFVPLVGCNQGAVIGLLIGGIFLYGPSAGGDCPAVVDMAPDHSGTLYGFTNAFASLPGILAPLFIGVLLDGKVS